MTPDEARKLLGGYATGSLTESERAALFQAALENQELFDELAGEQLLKEVLDEPGARQRLIAALETPRRHRAWLWASAATTLAVAVVIGVVVSQRTPPPPPQQIAQVLKSSEPVAAPVSPSPTAPAPAPLKRKVAPAPTPPASAAPEPQAKPQVASEALRVNGVPPASELLRLAFAFSYSVSADGFLEVTPMTRGFLSVTAGDSVIFPSAVINAGSPVRIAIPPEATSLVIAFSAMPGITGAPARRDGTTGTVTDQDPPNGKILIQLFLTPGTR